MTSDLTLVFALIMVSRLLWVSQTLKEDRSEEQAMACDIFFLPFYKSHPHSSSYPYFPHHLNSK